MRDTAQPWLLAGLFNWKSTISAIIVREIRTRFAGGSLGYGWAIILPVTWVLAITVFFQWIGRSAPVSIALPIFIASGMIPYLMFRQIVTSMMRVVRANRHLLTMGPATEEDLLNGGALLELVNMVLITMVVTIILAVFSTVPLPPDPIRVVTALLLAWALGASAGRFAASIAHYSDTAQRLVPILLRPFFWISGIFFVASELPRAAQDALWFNPLLHVIELLRTGLLPGFSSEFVVLKVPLIAIAGLYFTSRIIDALRHSRPLRGRMT